MGIAEVIPGVSGGTIAFITGIYEELINTIKSIDFSLVEVLRKEGIKGFWQAINGQFLLLLGSGMVIGVVTGIFVIGYLLSNYQAPLWAFFFGLIISSSIYIGRKIDQWNAGVLLLVILGFVIAFGVTLLSPAEGTTNYLIVLLSGMIAISALLLPGVSGSFILLLLGMYTIIRSQAEMALSTMAMSSLLVIGFFALGCFIGLVLFSRILSYTFKHYKNQTLAILTGFMLGSLNKIWPWRNPASWMDKNTNEIVNDVSVMSKDILLSDEIQLIKEVKVLPSDYLFFDPQITISIVSFLVGLGIVLVLSKFESEG